MHVVSVSVAPDAEEVPASLRWDMVVLAGADAKTLALKPDDEHDQGMVCQLESAAVGCSPVHSQNLVKALWERAAPGRAVKATASRDAFTKAVPDARADGRPVPPVEVLAAAAPPVLLDEALIAERAAACARDEHAHR
jgi:hypothetical protein